MLDWLRATTVTGVALLASGGVAIAHTPTGPKKPPPTADSLGDRTERGDFSPDTTAPRGSCRTASRVFRARRLESHTPGRYAQRHSRCHPGGQRRPSRPRTAAARARLHRDGRGPLHHLSRREDSTGWTNRGRPGHEGQPDTREEALTVSRPACCARPRGSPSPLQSLEARPRSEWSSALSRTRARPSQKRRGPQR